MASILLVFSILGTGLVIFWYVFDEAARDGEGRSGLLTMEGAKDTETDKPQPGWKTARARPWRAGRR